MAAIEPVFSFFEVQIKRVAGHAVELDLPAFGTTPEAFDAIEMKRTASKLIVAAIDPKVLVKAHIHQAIVGTPAVCMNDTGNVGSPPNDGL